MPHQIHFFDHTQKLMAFDFGFLKNWILNTVINEGRDVGELSFIFCTDDYLHKINLEFLDHNTFTDIITFDYCVGNIVSGEIYISVERIDENAKTFFQKFDREVCRIIIHGVLHLLGYKDKLPSDKLQMTAKEDYYLSLLPISK